MAKKVTKRKKTIDKIFKYPTSKSERIVADEIIDRCDGKRPTVRLLRAKRSQNSASAGLGIETWGPEREDFMEAWQVEAFVGLLSPNKLREGDVFFIVDGTKLNKYYGDKKRGRRALPREVAAEKHLLRPIDDSRELARNEIKKEFYKLSAVQTTKNKREQEKFLSMVDKKFEVKNPDKGRKRDK
jgi:hypothetical protein